MTMIKLKSLLNSLWASSSTSVIRLKISFLTSYIPFMKFICFNEITSNSFLPNASILNSSVCHHNSNHNSNVEFSEPSQSALHLWLNKDSRLKYNILDKVLSNYCTIVSFDLSTKLRSFLIAAVWYTVIPTLNQYSHPLCTADATDRCPPRLQI